MVPKISAMRERTSIRTLVDLDDALTIFGPSSHVNFGVTPSDERPVFGDIVGEEG